MPRPCKCREVKSNPKASCFKPSDFSLSELKEINLTIDEFEALRLADLEEMYQERAAKNMNVSRQTFGNIVRSARGKIADAIVNAKAIKIEGGVYKMCAKRKFNCRECGMSWKAAYGGCPFCGKRKDKDSGGYGRKCDK